MSFYIYTIHNILNNKIYVGKATNPWKRWQKHIRIAASKRQQEKFYIHRAVAKYGVNNFIFSVLQKFNIEQDCDLAEKYWIKYFQSKNTMYGYNLTEGGEGVSGRVVSEATRQKMREKATGRRHAPETIELLRIINIGKIPTNLDQLKIMNIGKSLSDEHCQKISQARLGMIFTEEHKQNISKSHVGLLSGDKNPFYGKTHTEEVKEKSRGENNKQSKLNAQKVIEIREKYNSGNYTHQQLANEYGISRRTITSVINYTTWRHI